MSLLFQIVFQGKLRDGFELAAVKASAARRLKAEPPQLERLFCGTRAVLKKGLSDEVAQKYFAELQRIGMDVSIEPEAVKITPAPDVSGDTGIVTSVKAKAEPQRFTSRDTPPFDPLKTQIAPKIDNTDTSPGRWSQPTIAISQPHLSALQAAQTSSASEATMIVPPRSGAQRTPQSTLSSEPTLVVSRGNTPSNDASSQATLIVPPRHMGASSDQTIVVPPKASTPHSHTSDMTMIVPPRQSAASEMTMVVPPRPAASSDETMIVAPRPSAASQATIIVRADQRFPPIVKPAAPSVSEFDPEKTELATQDAISNYMSPASDDELANAAPVSTPKLPPRAPRPASVTTEEVACPTCGDKQPKRVYCRRCGHALTLPASTSAIIAPRAEARPNPAASEETILVDELDESPLSKKEAGNNFMLLPAWVIVTFVFVLLLGVAAWLIV